MKLITLEEHWESAKVNEAAKPYRPKPAAQSHDPKDHTVANYFQSGERPNPADFPAANANRFKFMVQNGIAKQILGYGNNTVQNLNPAVAVDLAKMANDELADAIHAYPDQLGGWVTLPVGDPQAAADELDRAVTKLHLQGAMISGRYDGHFYDERLYDPLYAKAEELGVPLYFHPALIPAQIRDYYFSSGDWSELASFFFAGPAWGWHADLGIQMLRLIIAGTFDRFPKLQIVTGHWGEMIPNFLDRLDDMLDNPAMNEALSLKRGVAQTYKENFWVTPSGQFTWPQLQLDLTELGPDHLLYAIDYPYIQPDGAQKFLADAPIDQEIKEKIGHENAERLFHF